MLNDKMLGDLGLEPISTAMAAIAAAKLVAPLFGRSKEFLERQQRYDTIDLITDHYWAMMPDLPSYLRPTVEADVRGLMDRNVASKTVSDLDSAIAWFKGREEAWQLIKPTTEVVAPGVPSVISPSLDLRKGKVVTDPGTGKKALVSIETPTTVVYDRTTGQNVNILATDVPGAAPAVKEAGFPTWAIIAIGAAVVLPMLMKGR